MLRFQLAFHQVGDGLAGRFPVEENLGHFARDRQLDAVPLRERHCRPRRVHSFDDGSPSGALSTWRVTATDQDGNCTHANVSVGFCGSADEAQRRAARLLGIPADSVVVIP